MIARLANSRQVEPSTIRVAVVDTPYAFQENADALSAAALDFFHRRLNVAAEVAAYRGDVPLDRERAVAAIRGADMVFSGPGSPSHALRHWSDGAFSELLTVKLAAGGALIAASAAALTLGRYTAPIYEIYKVGADPHWLAGLDVLSELGLDVAVLPHFDNTEGGTHDTRYCFIGARRLEEMERQLPPETAILGVDEHTALVVDVAADRAAVHGRGTVTLRRHGQSRIFKSGAEFALAELRNDEPRQRRSVIEAATAAPDELARLSERIVELEAELETVRDRAQLVEPLIVQLLEIRRMARDMEEYAAADAIRDRLIELGIEVKDAAGGTDFVVS